MLFRNVFVMFMDDIMFQKSDHVVCPINSGHKIPFTSVDKHVQKCCLKSGGYDENEQFLSEPNPSLSSLTLGSYWNFYHYSALMFIFLDTSAKIDVLNAARSGKPTFRTGLFFCVDDHTQFTKNILFRQNTFIKD